MGLRVVQLSSAQSVASSSSISVTLTSTTVTGRLLVVAGANAGGRTISSVTDSGGSNSYTQATSAAATLASLTAGTDIWYCLNPTGGVTSVTVNFTGAAGTDNKEIYVWEVEGFSTAAFDVAAAVNDQIGSASTATGASVTTAAAIGFIAALIFNSNSITANPKVGDEFISSGVIGPTNDAACSHISSAAEAKQPQWTTNVVSALYCSSTAAFKETVFAAEQFFPFIKQ